MSAALTEEVKRAALGLGFARVGVARVEPLTIEAERLRAWLGAGRHGEMGYMETTANVRLDPAHERMLPGAKSIVVCVAPYGARQDESVDLAPGRVARYAWGRDYHNVLTKRMRKLVRVAHERGFEARGAVDAMPVFERAWAERAGVGFIGKNCCLIVPGLGSHLFLAAMITTAELEPDEPMKERCGTCTRCLDACPTKAFVAERELDARRCISYLTIEHRGATPPELRDGVGEWAFGCDVCQDVCPFNAGHGMDDTEAPEFARDARWQGVSAVDWLTMDEVRFDALTIGSPLRRAKREGLARNAAMVLGNRGTKVHLPVLRERAREDASPVVREMAEWAVEKIEEREG